MSTISTKKAIEVSIEDKTAYAKVLIPVTLSNSTYFENSLKEINAIKEVDKFILDCSDITEYDAYFVAFLNIIKKESEENDAEFELNGITEKIQSFIDILTPKIEQPDKVVNKEGKFFGFFVGIGEVAIDFSKDIFQLVEFMGLLFMRLISLLYKPMAVRWKDFPVFFIRSGINALPIAVLIVFLMGLITGYQGAVQLAQFGADVYIADLIGISITRELAPIMAAIIVAGRSGSAFAAEIGTMKVSDEVDALESMGYDKMYFLVIPRVLAVTFALPIIVLICDVAGVGAGMLTALLTLDLTVTSFLNQLNATLFISDILTGVFKAFVFGFIISSIGCFRGLQVKGGAESVGRFTTASVVSSIFLIIVVDAVFVFVFQALNV